MRIYRWNIVDCEHSKYRLGARAHDGGGRLLPRNGDLEEECGRRSAEIAQNCHNTSNCLIGHMSPWYDFSCFDRNKFAWLVDSDEKLTTYFAANTCQLPAFSILPRVGLDDTGTDGGRGSRVQVNLALVLREHVQQLQTHTFPTVSTVL